MKNPIPDSARFISAGLCLLFSLLANHARAQQAWDPNNTASIGGNSTWDTSTKNWTPNGTQTQVAAGSLVAWTANDVALFCAGPSSSSSQGGPWTITVNGAINCGGIVNGYYNPGSCIVTLANGASGSLNLSGATTFTTAGSVCGTTTINVPITGTGPLTAFGCGGLTLGAANTFTGGFEIDGTGGVSFGNKAAFGTGTITWVVAGFIQPVGSSAYTITNAMTHLAAIETFAGNSGGVAFSGPWTLPSSGTVTIENIANTITVSGVISGAAALTTTNNGGVGWTLTGVNTYSGNTTNLSGTLTIGGAGQLGSGTYAKALANSGTFTYASTAAQTLSGVISGTGVLTQTDNGTLTLSAVNTYSGATTVSGGKLVGVTGGSCANSTVTVSSGATNGVAITDNTQQWTWGGLTFSSGTPALDFNFGCSVTPSPSLAPLNVSGAAAFTGTPTVTVEAGSLPAGSGAYPLMTWTSTSGNPPTSVTLPPHASGNLSVSGNTLYLNVTNTGPLRWTGAASSAWDINNSLNWDDSTGTPAKYLETTLPGDAVILDETYITASPVIALNTTVTPGNVTVSNSTYSYTIGGSGAIAGSTGLTKQGSGTLTLTNVNTYSGATTISSGTLAIGGAGSLGSGTYSDAIANGGTFTYDSSAGQTLSGIISGSGTLTQQGTGTLTLSGANTYTGITTINNGSLAITADDNLGAAPGSPVATQLTLNNYINGGANDYGLRVQNANFTLNANRGITLGANGGSINVQNTRTLTVAGVITGNGDFWASPNSSAGYGTIILNANNTYTGATYIGAGTLELGVNGALPSGTPLTIGSSYQGAADGSFFDMNGESQTIGSLASNTGFGRTGSGTPTIKLTGALTINQTSSTSFAGAITNSGGSLTLTGGGTLTLSGTNTYTGATTVSAGTLLVNGQNGTSAVEVQAGATLGGAGSLSGPVTVDAGATLSPGISIGTLTISNNLTLTGNLFIAVNKSLSPSNSMVVVTGTLTNAGAGTLTVTNLGTPPLAAGDSFTIFSQPLLNGGALTLAGALPTGLVWTNKLAVDGTIAVSSTAPPYLQWVLNTGNTLHFSWTNAGVKLQVQTNSLGIGTNWYDYPGGGVSPIDVSIDPANPPVFFRLLTE